MSKVPKWQEWHRDNGYHVERLSAGQTRPYGPTLYSYIVIALNHNPSEEVVREYCTTKVERADDPLRHTLLTHLMKFKRLAPRTYYYQCGHEWDG